MGRHFKNDIPPAYKLHVRFKDGGKANLKSRDWDGKRHDPDAGLLALEKYLVQKSDRVIYGIIYDKRESPDRVIRYFRAGIWRDPAELETQPRKPI